MRQITEAAKKYDRSLVLVGSAILTSAIVYVTLRGAFNQLLEASAVIKELQQVNAVQKQINEDFKEGMRDIKSDIKLILREMRNNKQK